MKCVILKIEQDCTKICNKNTELKKFIESFEQFHQSYQKLKMISRK